MKNNEFTKIEIIILTQVISQAIAELEKILKDLDAGYYVSREIIKRYYVALNKIILSKGRDDE